jgi:hypothetical protein
MGKGRRAIGNIQLAIGNRQIFVRFAIPEEIEEGLFNFMSPIYNETALRGKCI